MRSKIQTSAVGLTRGNGATIVSTNLSVAEAVLHALGDRSAVVLHDAEAALASRTCLAPRLAIVVENDADVAVDTLRLLKRRWPTTRFVVQGLPNREDAILRCVAAGVDGIVLAEEPLRQLRRAVRNAMAGRFHAPHDATRSLFNRLVLLEGRDGEKNARPHVARLSQRENEILTRVASGATNKDIAVGLGIEVQTVKNHLNHIMRKLRVHSRFDAARVGSPLRV